MNRGASEDKMKDEEEGGKKTVESERVTITWVESIIEVREKEIFALGNLCALFCDRRTGRYAHSPLEVNHIGSILHGTGYGRSHLSGCWAPLLGTEAVSQ